MFRGILIVGVIDILIAYLIMKLAGIAFYPVIIIVVLLSLVGLYFLGASGDEDDKK